MLNSKVMTTNDVMPITRVTKMLHISAYDKLTFISKPWLQVKEVIYMPHNYTETVLCIHYPWLLCQTHFI